MARWGRGIIGYVVRRLATITSTTLFKQLRWQGWFLFGGLYVREKMPTSVRRQRRGGRGRQNQGRSRGRGGIYACMHARRAQI